jgi:small subunit ribosomal protein S15
MYLSKEYKENIFKEYSTNGQTTSTGDPESQVALFTKRIEHLTEHLKEHKHDNSTRLGLLKLVGKRKKMLSYLKNKDISRYRAIIAKLGLRK